MAGNNLEVKVKIGGIDVAKKDLETYVKGVEEAGKKTEKAVEGIESFGRIAQGGFRLAVESMVAFGAENKKVTETVAKVAAGIEIVNLATDIYSNKTKLAAAAQWAFNAAQLANPTVAITAAVVALSAAMVVYSKNLFDVTGKEKALHEQNLLLIQDNKTLASSTLKIVEANKETIATEQQILDARMDESKAIREASDAEIDMLIYKKKISREAALEITQADRARALQMINTNKELDDDTKKTLKDQVNAYHDALDNEFVLRQDYEQKIRDLKKQAAVETKKGFAQERETLDQWHKEQLDKFKDNQEAMAAVESIYRVRRRKIQQDELAHWEEVKKEREDIAKEWEGIRQAAEERQQEVSEEREKQRQDFAMRQEEAAAEYERTLRQQMLEDNEQAYQHDMANLKLSYDDKQKSIEDYYNNLRMLSDQDSRTQEKINKKELDDKKQLNKDKINSAISSARTIANALNDIGAAVDEIEQNRLKKGEKMTADAQKKAFQRKKALALVNTAINIAEGVAVSMTIPPPASWINAAAVGVAGAVQIAAIMSKQFEPDDSGSSSGSAKGSTYAKGGKRGFNGMIQGASHAAGGVRIGYDEMEGGEAIVNRAATMRYKGLLSAINASTGGNTFATEKEMSDAVNGMGSAAPARAYVLATDVMNAAEAQSRVDRLSRL